MTEIENQLDAEAVGEMTETPATPDEDSAVGVSAARERVVALARLRDLALVPPLILILAIGYLSEGSVFTGVLLLFEIQTLLTYMGVPSEWLRALNGLIILLALVLARVASGRSQN